MKLFIRYMVSQRCIMIVKQELKNLGLKNIIVELGVVDISDNITNDQHEKLKASLLKYGLELMDDKKAVLIEKLKSLIIEMIHYTNEIPKENFTDYISKRLNYDYTFLANLFLEVKGTTIEKFIIFHKIEHVKELLVYNELNLTEIASKMNYSSVAYLSNQFKKTTGLTPSRFKQLRDIRRKVIVKG